MACVMALKEERNGFEQLIFRVWKAKYKKGNNRVRVFRLVLKMKCMPMKKMLCLAAVFWPHHENKISVVCFFFSLTLTVYEVRSFVRSFVRLSHSKSGHKENLYQLLPFPISFLLWIKTKLRVISNQWIVFTQKKTYFLSLSICECHKLQTILYCWMVAFITEELINLSTIAQREIKIFSSSAFCFENNNNKTT